MTLLKKSFLFILSIVFIYVIWIFLPLQIKYYNKIKQGNQFVANIEKYKKKIGKLPENIETEVLIKLNPINPYENFYPQYLKLNDEHFELVYIDGLEPPFLRYNSKSKKWNRN